MPTASHETLEAEVIRRLARRLEGGQRRPAAPPSTRAPMLVRRVRG
jgi:hypothetical protein